MKKVILESPYRGKTDTETTNNETYAKLCMINCLSRRESPMASHLLYTQVLNDDKPKQRELGMKAGFAWYSSADYVVVYEDLGISDGMAKGIAYAESLGLEIKYRKLYA
jgi:hypothetical protein